MTSVALDLRPGAKLRMRSSPTAFIRARILISYAVVLAVVIATGGAAYTRLVHVEQQASSVQMDTAPGLYNGMQIMLSSTLSYALVEAQAIEAEPGAVRAIGVKIDAERAKLDAAISAYEKTIYQLKDRENFESFKAARKSYLSAEEELRQARRENKDADARESINLKVRPAFDKLLTAVQALIDWNKASLDDSTRDIAFGVVAAKTGIAASCAAALLVAIVTGYYLQRSIAIPLRRLVGVANGMRQGDFSQRLELDRHDEFGVLAAGFNRMMDEVSALIGQVQKAGIQVNTSITEIAATSKQQQATASEIAATTTEIGATSRQISATSNELVRTMKEVSAVAEQTAVLAGNGQTGLSHMDEMMGRVVEAAGSINGKLGVLNVKAGNINQVVTTITKVADQTNLLSLNAAIEAEKAGEYGRGFAVVATEIRRLADQTAVASGEIETMVKDIHSAVSAGVMGMDKFSEEVRRGMQEIHQVSAQLSQIIHEVQTLAPRFETVSEGMQAQATGAAQITEALAQLSEAAQQTVDSLRQSNLTVEQLNQVSNNLRSSISRFRLQP